MLVKKKKRWTDISISGGIVIFSYIPVEFGWDRRIQEIHAPELKQKNGSHDIIHKKELGSRTEVT